MTQRMDIRPFTMADDMDLQEILGDEETMENCEPAYDLEKTRRFLKDFCIERHGALAAVQRVSSKVIGYILFSEWTTGVYEMGWFFNRKYWRQGYAYEACRAVMDEAFSKMKVHRVFAETIDTGKSAPLMEKLGMRLEGVQRSHVWNPRGHWADMHLYGILESDWKGKNNSATGIE